MFSFYIWLRLRTWFNQQVIGARSHAFCWNHHRHVNLLKKKNNGTLVVLFEVYSSENLDSEVEQLMDSLLHFFYLWCWWRVGIVYLLLLIDSFLVSLIIFCKFFPFVFASTLSLFFDWIVVCGDSFANLKAWIQFFSAWLLPFKTGCGKDHWHVKQTQN